MLDFFLAQNDSLLLIFKLEGIVPDHQPCVLLCSQLAVRLYAKLCLLLVVAQLRNRTFHLVNTQVEFFNLVGIALLTLVSISQVAFYVVLVQFHKPSQILVFVL